MKPLACREFGKKSEEWIAGELPDHERSEMAAHIRECDACREKVAIDRLIIQTAREETLELPSDVYFADLSIRIEEDLEREGAFIKAKTYFARPRRRLLSPAEWSGLAASFMAVMVWSSVFMAVSAGEQEALDRPVARMGGTGRVAEMVPAEPHTIVVAAKTRDKKIQEIYDSVEFT